MASGGWDATETQTVARARATGSTQLRVWMGHAPGVTILDAKKASESGRLQRSLKLWSSESRDG